VSYRLHPAAAEEHLEHISFYEAQQRGLGKRYDDAFESALRVICDAPARFRIIAEPDIRSTMLRGFPYSVLYHEAGGVVEVLAVAHHRRRPGYWRERLTTK
jgi:plasmid stabilization system protein ParE